MKKEKFICIFCNKEFEGFGNNPDPIAKEGRCCDRCNNNKVIPMRIKVIKRS